MQRLYEAQNEIEAQLLIDYLASSHIPTTLRGRYLSGAAGDLSALTFPAVWVLHDADLPRAQQLLAEFQQRRSSEQAGAAWPCSGCGTLIEPSFDLCWQCGRARD